MTLVSHRCCTDDACNGVMLQQTNWQWKTRRYSTSIDSRSVGRSVNPLRWRPPRASRSFRRSIARPSNSAEAEDLFLCRGRWQSIGVDKLFAVWLVLSVNSIYCHDTAELFEVHTSRSVRINDAIYLTLLSSFKRLALFPVLWRLRYPRCSQRTSTVA